MALWLERSPPAFFISESETGHGLQARGLQELFLNDRFYGKILHRNLIYLVFGLNWSLIKFQH